MSIIQAKTNLSSPKCHSSYILSFEYFFSDTESSLCVIIKESLITKEVIFNPEPKPTWGICRRQMWSDVVRWYLFGFQWSQRFSLKWKQVKKIDLSPSARIYSQILKAAIKPMTFHHLLNSPAFIPIEIKKNSLFWGTTSYRTGSRAQFLSLTLKTKTSTFKTAEVLSNSYHAKTMMLWLTNRK